jgi:hypothetical protein
LRVNPTAVRFHAPPAEREAQAQSCSIGASPLERAEQVVGVRRRETAAVVLDLDQDPLGTRADAQRDCARLGQYWRRRPNGLTVSYQ